MCWCDHEDSLPQWTICQHVSNSSEYNCTISWTTWYQLEWLFGLVSNKALLVLLAAHVHNNMFLAMHSCKVLMLRCSTCTGYWASLQDGGPMKWANWRFHLGELIWRAAGVFKWCKKKLFTTQTLSTELKHFHNTLLILFFTSYSALHGQNRSCIWTVLRKVRERF